MAIQAALTGHIEDEIWLAAFMSIAEGNDRVTRLLQPFVNAYAGSPAIMSLDKDKASRFLKLLADRGDLNTAAFKMDAMSLATRPSTKDTPTDSTAALSRIPAIEQQFLAFCVREAKEHSELRGAYRTVMQRIHSRDSFSVTVLHSAAANRRTESLQEVFDQVANILLPEEKGEVTADLE